MQFFKKKKLKYLVFRYKHINLGQWRKNTDTHTLVVHRMHVHAGTKFYSIYLFFLFYENTYLQNMYHTEMKNMFHHMTNKSNFNDFLKSCNMPSSLEIPSQKVSERRMKKRKIPKKFFLQNQSHSASFSSVY